MRGQSGIFDIDDRLKRLSGDSTRVGRTAGGVLCSIEIFARLSLRHSGPQQARGGGRRSGQNDKTR
jgi:hypothetical protein